MSARRPTRAARAVVGVGLVLIVGSLGAWALTGREGYTRWPDAKLSAADQPAPDATDDLLDDIGLTTSEDPAPSIESRFAFGLAPSGLDPKHLISVAPASGLGVAMVGAGVIHRRRAGRASVPTREERRT